MDIRTFQGLRPMPSLATRIAAPHSAQLSPKQRDSVLQQEGRSFLRLTAQVEKVDAARGRFLAWQRDEILQREPAPCAYLYAASNAEPIRLGLVATIPLTDLAHLSPAEDTAISDLCARLSAQLEPVVLNIPDSAVLSDLFTHLEKAKPSLEVEYDGVAHKLWRILDLSDLKSAFDTIQPGRIIGGGAWLAAMRAVHAQRSSALPYPSEMARHSECLCLLLPESAPATDAEPSLSPLSGLYVHTFEPEMQA